MPRRRRIVRVEWIADEGAFELLAEEWDDLARARSPFVRHGWLAAWWDAFGGDRELAVCTARDGERLVAALPLYRRGAALHALANEHSPRFTALGDGDALAAVVAAALAEAPVLELPLLDQDDPLLGALTAASRGRLVLRERQALSPVVELGTSYERVLRSLPRSIRKDTARRRRRLEEAHEVRFELLGIPADLPSVLSRGFAVEASGWKGRYGTAILSRPETERFYREAGRRLAADGLLRITLVSAGGRDIAFDYCVLDGNRLWSLKCGFDEAYARFGPGNVMTLAEIECCCELGLNAFELLGDAEPWKLRWASGTRELVALRVYAPRPAALARYAYRRAVRPTARTAYRRVLAPGRRALARRGRGDAAGRELRTEDEAGRRAESALGRVADEAQAGDRGLEGAVEHRPPMLDRDP